MTGAGNSAYNGTYCFYAVNDGASGSGQGTNIYKHQTNNLYIYYGGDYAWIGPVVGNILAASDGYYYNGGYGYNGGELPVTGWSSYSCCGTDLGSAPTSVTQTTCGGTTTTTTATPGVQGYTVSGAGDSSFNGTYCLGDEKFDGKDVYSRGDYYIYWLGLSEMWVIKYQPGGPTYGGVVAYSAGNHASPPTDPTEWYVVEAASPAPTLTQTTCGGSTTTAPPENTLTVSGLTGEQSGANGVYVQAGTYNGKPYYAKGSYVQTTYEPFVNGEYIIIWGAFGYSTWNWYHNETGSFSASNTSDTPTPPTTDNPGTDTWAGAGAGLIITSG